MTIAYWCILVAIFLPYVWTVVAKSSKKGYSNNNPREFLASLEGMGARANAAQMNAFEALPGFIAAVIIAQQIGKIDQGTLDLLAMIFVAARVAHGICYIRDWATLRSLVWMVGLGCVVALFAMSA